MRICITVSNKEHKEMKELAKSVDMSIGLMLRFAFVDYQNKIKKQKRK